jgi:hypothetical protein
VIAPVDLISDQTALAITMISHAERKGMSVLRDAASNDEFKKIVSMRLKKPNQTFHGVASFASSEVRGLLADRSTEQRKAHDRLYYVLDTDMPDLPNHADIFATIPRSDKDPKRAWREEREKLLALLTTGLATPANFRNGAAIP